MFGGRIKNPKRPTVAQFLTRAAIFAAVITLIPALPALITPVIMIALLYFGIKATIWFWK